MSDEMVLAMCVGGFLGFGLGMMLFALVMRPADEAGRSGRRDVQKLRMQVQKWIKNSRPIRRAAIAMSRLRRSALRRLCGLIYKLIR